MTVMSPIAEDTATRFAFSLLRSAYLDLAQTLLRIDADPARELLQAVEHRIAYRLGALATDEVDGTEKETALARAAGQVQTVLRDAQAA
ncbi:hypothetical protein [Methylobacterium sp. J-070]|uniref:hypothetical protein n=1 Tax=Methylobacterium sp. J-070 TaxID=2836650 RepID=UPI001FBAC5E4|nr:hypothetical protein [Methylobacterium sp. J-070]MCJ2053170.1 hypothetical protein [Methylobacterium sp. J-070]